MNQDISFKQQWAKNPYPFIAILRGLTLAHAKPVSRALFNEGMSYIEVPLNTDHAFEAISVIIEELGDQALIGAGTVLNESQVKTVKQLGGQLIISPNMNESVIALTKALGMISIPGVYTVTEAFKALDAGADALKFYPSENLSPAVVKSMLTVLPKDKVYFSVGGISADSQLLNSYSTVGIDGFGIGGNLYKPEFSIESVIKNAKDYIVAWDEQKLPNRLGESI